MIISRTKKSSLNSPYYYFGDLNSLINKLKSLESGNIYCDGGAELAQSLIGVGLIDEIILSVIPVKLHKGTLVFKNGIVPAEFQIENQVEFKTGLKQYTYNLKLNL